MSTNNIEDETAAADEVETVSTAFWRYVAGQYLVGFAIYALIAIIAQLYVWMQSPIHPAGPAIEVVLTIDPGFGVGILAGLSAAAGFLHVAAWSTAQLNDDDVVAQTRKRYFALSGMSVGLLSAIVGVAVLFSGAPDRLELGAIIIAAWSVAVVVISADLSHLLGKDAPVQRRLPDAQRERAIRNLTAVTNRLRPDTQLAAAGTPIRVFMDMTAIAATAGLSIAAYVIFEAVVETKNINWPLTIGQIVLLSGFTTALALYTFGYTTRQFLSRNFAFAVCTLAIGMMAYAIAALSIVLSATTIWPDHSASVMRLACGSVALLLPAVLVCRGLRPQNSRSLPGSTLRVVMFRSISNELQKLRDFQPESTQTTASWAKRFAAWVNRTTGVDETDGH
ncbi:hypothetical protein [Rhodococcus sp. ARC_M6]|uniref:hypothetical protein n=1 Tax=Rhodococcus sp. ARC_M6 TaxID=2928852 RepID=UPI001FB3303A|nr:hypothetical protein [Rhodococcus sp. ARC_M6]MCJ0906921.1 hypothetical protein [Rhodococcus sp. ARC_M6]